MRSPVQSAVNVSNSHKYTTLVVVQYIREHTQKLVNFEKLYKLDEKSYVFELSRHSNPMTFLCLHAVYIEGGPKK